MNNPIIKINKETLDIVLEVLTFIGLGVLTLIPMYYFGELPELIPTHFNGKGLPDDYSSRSTIWLLPVIGSVLGIGLYVLNKFPHIFNYHTKITNDNAFRYYKNATRLIRVLNLIVVWVFVFIMYKSIAVALNRSEGLGIWFIPVFIGIMIGPIIYFLLKSSKT